ncbi:hypothetical protein JUN65_04435 [Gluconacetobacter azotocaptans]|uniref:hypothetical protein n=1 Tax=Gluconacetobacter azotocaptans TaxID=142834 RepID=UPI00195B9E2D|nr:hypothetical protein [Gluconacetobacter azotocaptans]MBM9400830.1 hypothetical protein [Gluconacetobacter azotocaptans]
MAMNVVGLVTSEVGVGFSRDLPPVTECIGAATVLPLLGGMGDTPLVEAKFEGKRGALFVSPQYGKFLVRNVSDDFWFVNDGAVSAIGIDQQREPAEWTHVERLQLGKLELHDLRALVVDRHFPAHVDGLPIVGIIGREFLTDYGLIELIDIPHKKLALFRWDHDRCGSSSRLLGPDAHVANLYDDGGVEGMIAGKHLRIHFNPDLDRNMFPLTGIAKLGLTAKALKERPQVMLDFAGKNHGFLSEKVPVSVAGFDLAPQDFLVVENIERVSLGYRFFLTRTVIFDFGYRTFATVDANERDSLPPTKHLHFDSYNIVDIGVQESTGALPAPDQRK